MHICPLFIAVISLLTLACRFYYQSPILSSACFLTDYESSIYLHSCPGSKQQPPVTQWHFPHPSHQHSMHRTVISSPFSLTMVREESLGADYSNSHVRCVKGDGAAMALSSIGLTGILGRRAGPAMAIDAMASEKKMESFILVWDFYRGDDKGKRGEGKICLVSRIAKAFISCTRGAQWQSRLVYFIAL